ncbi:MAG: isochorismatase family cysteine hydrolase [Candidatus Latescibacteria bacterium]|jgi:nicotinamidase-related amidase|nr:isochorismatase family cysteine hydrolase [Candidatus Latescibacterota bacterium]
MSTLKIKGRYYRLYPPEKYLGHAEETLELDTDSTAFLAVDVYGLGFSPDDHGEAHPYPTMGLPESFEVEKDIVVNHICPAMDAARRADLPVIYLNNSAPRIAINRSELAKTCLRSNGLDWEEWGSEDTVDPREYVHGNSTAVKFSKVVEPQEGDYLVRKHAYSGFFETRLDGLLRNLNIKTLVCVGFALDICLHCTMVDAMNLNYQVLLLRDCAMAMELPGELEGLAFTKRMVLWTEYCVGHSATSADFIAACDACEGASG